LFTGKTWDEFLSAGGNISGFRETRRKTVEQIQEGDYLLCYLTGVSRWIGVLEVTGRPFLDTVPVWSDEAFPWRLPVKRIVALTPETAVPIFELRDQLTFFRNLTSPIAWTGHFRGSPRRFNQTDGQVIVRALQDAAASPVRRPVDKLARRPQALKARAIGLVTVPEREATVEEGPRESREATAHEEIQWLLLKLGSDMGLEVWVARNDRGREVGGHRFADIPRLRRELPAQFDEATNRTIELIDVLWLRGNAIVAAFEIESTTSIYSGLLRMSDLIAMQPNLNIPLHLVVPDERRDKVITEVNRPTFSRLTPPMSQLCRYIAFSELRQRVAQIAAVARYLKPGFLEELSEPCEAEEV
jgi:hypothetical protein